MNESYPFYSNSLEAAGAGIYHTHPRCRIAQGIAPDLRVSGTGDGRKECPFCFILGQFQASRSLRSGQGLPGTGSMAEGQPQQGNGMAVSVVIGVLAALLG